MKSFVLNAAGFTCVTFTTGALAWYAPSYITDVGETNYIIRQGLTGFLAGHLKYGTA